jgi:hypothetical protein
MTVACFYKWVRARDGAGRAVSPYRRLYGVGINADGSLINRDNYPEELVRTSITAHQAARAESIALGVLTRAKRREDDVWQAVKRWRAGTLAAGRACIICGRALSDPPSIARSIGPECWPRVLKWDRRVAAKLFAEGVDQQAMLAKIAALRAALIEQADEIIRRDAGQIARERRYETLRWRSGASEDFQEHWIVDGADRVARSNQEERLRDLDRIAEGLDRGRFDARALRRLDGIDAVCPGPRPSFGFQSITQLTLRA